MLTFENVDFQKVDYQKVHFEQMTFKEINLTFSNLIFTLFPIKSLQTNQASCLPPNWNGETAAHVQVVLAVQAGACGRFQDAHLWSLPWVVLLQFNVRPNPFASWKFLAVWFLSWRWEALPFASLGG